MTSFPHGFIWGVGASSYQIEGGRRDHGRGDSIWDTFCRVPGAVYNAHSGDIACDHVNRFREDAQLMRELGVRHYRLSISWPRVIPDGDGSVSGPGIKFYQDLIDALLAAGIEPWVTLFHWDLPQALQDRGGWVNRAVVGAFERYVTTVVDALSDRVTNWITINEPQIFIGYGHLTGVHAPGVKLPMADVLLAAHHALLAHGTAARVIRARASKPPLIGWAPIGGACYPMTDSPSDVDAAREAMFTVRRANMHNAPWFGDPVMLGHYPESGLRLFGADAPTPQPGDMDLIRAPIDFFGVNIYDADPIRAGSDGKPEQVTFPPGHPQTAVRWPITPDALRYGCLFTHERYRIPVIVTENGMSCIDWVHSDGAVHDPQRIDFTAGALRGLARAIADGADVRGYFHWSIMDNFEWQEGYKERFGLVHVDFSTQKRTPKQSAYWYRAVMARNGL